MPPAGWLSLRVTPEPAQPDLAVPLSRAMLFLRMFSAPLPVSVLEYLAGLYDLPEREDPSPVLAVLVTGSSVVTLLVLLSETRLEISLVSRAGLSATGLSPL